MRLASPSTARAAAIDLPGHGSSNWRSDGRYEPRQVAAAVTAVTAVTVL
jgi:pimeloyl-ACP methyl ester carboxylesterase